MNDRPVVPGPWPVPPPPDHPDELLTAYLDGQADTAEAVAVASHLESCERCRHTLTAERACRDVLRTLPAVAPPDDFYERLLVTGPQPRVRAHRRTGFAVANIAAAAAVWLGVVAVARITGGQTVQPAIGDLVSAHTSMLPSQFASRPKTSESVPLTLTASYQLVGVGTVSGRRQAVYTDGQRYLSMFVEPGRLDVSALPADAEQFVVDGLTAWHVRTDDADVVLVQRGDVVIGLVGSSAADDPALMEVADARPASPSLGDRLDAAERGLLEAFGLG